LLGGAFGWLYLEYGAVVIPLVALPILIARQTFKSSLQLRSAYEDTLRLLVRALEEKDRYTAGHASRVARYAHYIGEELGFSSARLERLRYAALMHDVGKLVVPNHLLNKPGPLTAEEYDVVRRHEEVSVEILNLIDFLRPVAPSALGEGHHYEDGVEVLEPHIVAVADAYDAMTSTRSYRRALAQAVAYEELRSRAGSQFHPQCVDALVTAVERRGERHGDGHEPLENAFIVPPPVAGTGSAGLGDLAPASFPSAQSHMHA
jgi:HD-GYP domain-containing protein (c-di-GMP phosphodiesterase class II)